MLMMEAAEVIADRDAFVVVEELYALAYGKARGRP
jgi:hypothetical protein